MKLLLVFCLTVLFTHVHRVSADPVSLTFYVPSAATTETSRSYWNLAQEFEQKNPDIHILFSPSDSYENVLTKVFEKTSKNESAGVFVGEISEILTLTENKVSCALDSFIEGEKDGKTEYLSKFIPQSLANSYGKDGKIYSLPLFRSTPSIYYNLDILGRAGVNISELPEDWLAFEELLKTVKRHTNKAPLGLAGSWYDWIFEAFVSTNDGNLVTPEGKVWLDNPAVIETLEFWVRLKDQGLLERIDEPWKNAIHRFVYSQAYPVIFYSTGGIKFAELNTDFKWTIDIIPYNRRASTVFGGGNIFMSCNMNQLEQQAAWRFINFMLSPVAQARLIQQSGYFPIVHDAFNSPTLKMRYLKGPHKKALHQLIFSQAKSTTPNYQEFRNLLKNAIDQALDHGAPPHQTLTSAQALALQKGM